MVEPSGHVYHFMADEQLDTSGHAHVLTPAMAELAVVATAK